MSDLHKTKHDEDSDDSDDEASGGDEDAKIVYKSLRCVCFVLLVVRATSKKISFSFIFSKYMYDLNGLLFLIILQKIKYQNVIFQQ